MGLACGRERLLDADVKLASSAEREPGAAARAQSLGLLELLQTEQLAEESPRLRLAAWRRRNLNVVEDHSVLAGAASACCSACSGFVSPVPFCACFVAAAPPS